jgi:hypothetical protein
LDLVGIAALGLYDHQFYHDADKKTDYLALAIEYYTTALMLSNTSAAAHSGNVRIEVELTYFNAYGPKQLDAIVPGKWPFANSYATAWSVFNGTFGPFAQATGWPKQRPLNAYADAAYAKVRLLGASVDFFLANDTKAAVFVAGVRGLVTKAMTRSDPNSTTCQGAERSQWHASVTNLEPWCKFDSTGTARQFQAVGGRALFLFLSFCKLACSATAIVSHVACVRPW